MAESARNEMALKFNGVIKPMEEIPHDKLVDAVPIITAIKMARQNAAKLGYRFRVPKFSPRNPENEPNALEKDALEQIHSKGLKELIVRQKGAIHYFKPIALTAECLFCHGDPKGARDPIGGVKEGWKEGEIHGAFEIIYSLDQAVEQTQRAAWAIGATTAGVLLLIIGAAWFIMRNSLVAPLVRLQHFARQISEGELNTQPRGTFKAELRALERALTGMVVRLKEKISFSEQKTAEAEASEARAQLHAKEAADARDDVLKSRAQGMVEAANMLEGVVGSVTSASQEISAQVEQSSNFAANQADSMNAVAAAMEEMNSSILEVSNNAAQVSSSSEIIKENANRELKEVTVMVDAIKSVQTMERLLPLPCVCQNTPSFLAASTSPASRSVIIWAMALFTPRYWWFLATFLIRPPRANSNRVKFSTMSSSRRLSQRPRMAVSRLVEPASVSSSIRRHSKKCSQGLVRVPTRVCVPLDSRMNALGWKSCGMLWPL